MSEIPFRYTLIEHGDICVLNIEEPRVDTTKAPAFKTELLRILSDGWKRILVNLGNTEAIDSSGLGALTFGKRQADDADGILAVCCLPSKVQSLFDIAKLDRIFTVYDTVEDGLFDLSG